MATQVAESWSRRFNDACVPARPVYTPPRRLLTLRSGSRGMVETHKSGPEVVLAARDACEVGPS